MVFKTRHTFESLLPRAIYLGFACCGVVVALGAAAESISEEELRSDLVGKKKTDKHTDYGSIFRCH